VNVLSQDAAKVLAEVVVQGYRTVQRNLYFSRSNNSAANIENRPNANAINTLQVNWRVLNYSFNRAAWSEINSTIRYGTSMVILILYMLLMDFQQMQIISGLLTRMTSRLYSFERCCCNYTIW
jgi:hypothetical protein